MFILKEISLACFYQVLRFYVDCIFFLFPRKVWLPGLTYHVWRISFLANSVTFVSAKSCQISGIISMSALCMSFLPTFFFFFYTITNITNTASMFRGSSERGWPWLSTISYSFVTLSKIFLFDIPPNIFLTSSCKSPSGRSLAVCICLGCLGCVKSSSQSFLIICLEI